MIFLVQSSCESEPHCYVNRFHVSNSRPTYSERCNFISLSRLLAWEIRIFSRQDKFLIKQIDISEFCGA